MSYSNQWKMYAWKCCNSLRQGRFAGFSDSLVPLLIHHNWMQNGAGKHQVGFSSLALVSFMSVQGSSRYQFVFLFLDAKETEDWILNHTVWLFLKCCITIRHVVFHLKIWEDENLTNIPPEGKTLIKIRKISHKFFCFFLS